MPFKEAAFWVCLTMFGTGLYFIFDSAAIQRGGAWLLIVVGLLGIGYLVLQYHYPMAKLPTTGAWVWLPLILTWMFLGYTIYLDSNRPTQVKIPEFDDKSSATVINYGEDTSNSCFMTVNGSVFLSRQKDYKLAIACFVSDGRQDTLDISYLQLSNPYDIRDGAISMRSIFQPYFDGYRRQINSPNGIGVVLLNVPNGVQMSQIITLRQARSLGVKIVALQTAAAAPIQPN